MSVYFKDRNRTSFTWLVDTDHVFTGHDIQRLAEVYGPGEYLVQDDTEGDGPRKRVYRLFKVEYGFHVSRV